MQTGRILIDYLKYDTRSPYHGGTLVLYRFDWIEQILNDSKPWFCFFQMDRLSN